MKWELANFEMENQSVLGGGRREVEQSREYMVEYVKMLKGHLWSLQITLFGGLSSATEKFFPR